MNQRQRKFHDKVKSASGLLNLDENQIGDNEARAIAEALKVNKTLTELHLYTNRIGDAGAKAIAEALKVNKTMTLLHLQQNHIGNAGTHAIAEALKANTRLRELFLSENQIGDAGAQAIAEALKVNKTLISLTLYENFLTNDAIAELRRTGNAVCKLDFEAGKLDDQRVPSPEELALLANAASDIQQLRSSLAANEQELATKEQELQQLRSDLAAKDQELKSALEQIDVLKRHQPAFESAVDFDGHIQQVSLATLVTATNNFAAGSFLGEGAFGRVYGASLLGPPVAVAVAIKKLSTEAKQGAAEFKSELDSLSKFRHANIIAILSYAEEGDERCLVYEFMPNGSVRDRLSRKNDTPALTWSQRHRIAVDVSRGMHYVQTAFPDHALFHLDLKTDNVLLDAHFNAKVSDFGLVRAAKHLDDKSYLRTQTVQGTIAYMCPEFLEEGRMTVKTDVYAFGMILLELTTAAKPGTRLRSEVRKAVKNQTINGMLDSALKPTEAESQSLSELVTLALECLEDAPDDRPSFGRLLATLDP
ncbi:hypothetical protein CAOG_08896 [Capsaspora owczarzaki ATCC 30864]|uniref:TKL/IRAK protein kinase n=1 Tax=Capsaspora owczarzaki (strain ATCC 30864) TaxID=595528 RepID=A0A0D2WTH1_CAPO3|nr:hypothetical protein CAOG_08896 [Capsaspora owczarzaki ATCC 30864]KJE94948.1 TKL/IRAK protein kinase [Capsaspora owczarzaki ATCC 30864]|eukprot:XP_011270558.1 hypothetical protein CAOG_08896 [Capsaspora owczarzaki ATCC 30864]